MITHQANGFAHAGERHGISYPANVLSLSARSPMERLGSAVQVGMYSVNTLSGYHGSPGQADQYLTKSFTHPRYTQQDHPSGHNSQSYGQVGGPDKRHRPVRRGFQEYQDKSHTPQENKRPFSPLAESYTIETLSISSPHSCSPPNAALENVGHLYSSALQFSDSEGAPAQFGQPVYEGRSADRAVPDKVQGIYDKIPLPLSSPGWNSGLKSLKIPNWQHLTVGTPSSSPPAQDARQSPAIRNSTPPSQPLSKRCPHCNREFTGSSKKGNMSRHIRTKHGAHGSVAREYPCSSRVCGKKFRRNDAKLNHERKEHPELGRLSAIPRKPLNRPATRNPQPMYVHSTEVTMELDISA